MREPPFTRECQLRIVTCSLHPRLTEARRQMPGRHIRMLRRVGHRGSVLGGFACVCFAYGGGILLGYRPTFTHALGVDVAVFGWAFIGLGVFALTGAFSRRGHDAAQYATSVLGVTAWALLISTHWTQPVGWTAAVSWDGIALGLLLASAWPNVPRVHEPDTTAIEKLVSELAADHDD